MQHVGLIDHCLRLSLWQVWAERKRSGAGHNSGGAERSGAGLRKIGRSGAERERGAAERERSGERTKSAAPATAPADILLFSLSSRDTKKIRFNAERQNLPLRSAHMLCPSVRPSVVCLSVYDLSVCLSGTSRALWKRWEHRRNYIEARGGTCLLLISWF